MHIKAQEHGCLGCVVQVCASIPASKGEDEEPGIPLGRGAISNYQMKSSTSLHFCFILSFYIFYCLSENHVSKYEDCSNKVGDAGEGVHSFMHSSSSQSVEPWGASFVLDDSPLRNHSLSSDGIY